jgi:hypothetical protein
MNWLRTKICFAQIRALILCVRGSRTPWYQHTLDSTDIALKMMSTPVHMRELCLRFELLYL